MSEQKFYLNPNGNMYRLMRDSYYGDGGYRGPYLIPIREKQMKLPGPSADILLSEPFFPDCECAGRSHI